MNTEFETLVEIHKYTPDLGPCLNWDVRDGVIQGEPQFRSPEGMARILRGEYKAQGPWTHFSVLPKAEDMKAECSKCGHR